MPPGLLTRVNGHGILARQSAPYQGTAAAVPPLPTKMSSRGASAPRDLQLRAAAMPPIFFSEKRLADQSTISFDTRRRLDAHLLLLANAIANANPATPINSKTQARQPSASPRPARDDRAQASADVIERHVQSCGRRARASGDDSGLHRSDGLEDEDAAGEAARVLR